MTFEKRCFGLGTAVLAVLASLFFISFPAFGGEGDDETANARFCVVEGILPVMEAPGMPYKLAEYGLEDYEGVEGAVVYGNHIDVAPIEGEHADGWGRLEYEGQMLGYVERKGLEPLPDYEVLGGTLFQVMRDEPLLLLHPDAADKRYNLAGRSFFLLKGEVVPAFGKTERNGKQWVLLAFDTDPESGEAGAGARYAWCGAEDLLDLERSAPVLSEVRRDRVPNRFRDAGPLPEAALEGIIRQGFWIDPEPLLAGHLSVDDMADLYANGGANDPDFITTDLFFHAYHLVFDRMLQKLEMAYFGPALKTLLSGSLERLENLDLPDTSHVAAAAALTGDLLKLGSALLDEDPGVLSGDAAAEYERIVLAEGGGRSLLTGVAEDYTQYRPRGHYTLSPRQERYFRAMSLLGNAHIALGAGEPDPALRLRNAAAVALFCVLFGEPALAPSWRRLQDPLSYMIGRSDDNGPDELGGAVRKVLQNDLSRLGDSSVLEELERELLHRAAAPRIADKQTGGVSDAAQEAQDATGFRVMGKRFVPDAWIFDRLTHPSVFGRTIPDAAEVMAVLGSDAADEAVEPYRKDFADAGYGTELEKMKKEVAEFLASPDGDTAYSSWLRVLSESFADSGSGQFFYRSGAWRWKKLTAALASWAEMKHDTVLYAKQSGAEMGEGGEWLPGNFALPQPRGYVEPDPRAFGAMMAALERLGGMFEKYEIEDYEYPGKIGQLREMCEVARDIAEKEVSDAPLTAADYLSIRQLAREFDSRLLLPWGMYGAENGEEYGGGYLYSENGDSLQDQIRMAIVTDVATDFEDGVALHVATGTPRRLYAFVEDRSGGARVAVGYVFTYYEFPRALDGGRMTDEEWKKEVYDERAQEDLEKLRPSWSGNLR